MIRTQKAKTNHKGLTEFWYRNISADGDIENILIDGNEPDEEKTEAGDRLVCKRFGRPLQRGDTFLMELSYDLLKSFSGNPEGLIHVVDYKTKKLRMVVNFHTDKPCRTARAFLRFGGQAHKPLPQPTLNSNKTKIEIEIKRPRLGADYYLEWDW